MRRGQAAVRQVGWFPAAPVVAILHDWLAQQEQLTAEDKNMDMARWRQSLASDGESHVTQMTTMKRLAFDAKVSVDVLWKLKCSAKVWVDFDTADRLVCAINPFLWHSDPELSRAYQDFDLGRLDAARPIEKEVMAA